MGHKVNDKVGDMLGDSEDKEGHPIGDNAEHKMGQRRKILWERGREVTDTVGGGRQSGRRSGVQSKKTVEGMRQSGRQDKVGDTMGDDLEDKVGGKAEDNVGETVAETVGNRLGEAAGQRRKTQW